ncbi:MAG TPA: hypothetical protein VJT71_04290 [Pyrinomonadaceae bacterium]|nr:hypothetical protein [Pyrinomonadaceae bacterium]
MTFWERSGKTIIIAALSLLVALITFGVLGSTGAFKNSVYDLGGSIVGFLATAYLLKRIFEATPPSEKSDTDESEGMSYSSDDTVQILDMRNQRPVRKTNEPNPTKNRVVLTEHYRLRKHAEVSEIVFTYSTNGEGMEGACVSPGFEQELRETTMDPRAADERKHLEKDYEIRLDVQSVPLGQPINLHIVVTYIGAFDGPDNDWFHTHVNFTTRSKILILLFPPGQPCLRVKAREKIGSEPERDVDPKKGLPLVLSDRRIVYWRVDSPQPGQKYKLNWFWNNTDTSAT